jgi:hypothetical protein
VKWGVRSRSELSRRASDGKPSQCEWGLACAAIEPVLTQWWRRGFQRARSASARAACSPSAATRGAPRPVVVRRRVRGPAQRRRPRKEGDDEHHKPDERPPYRGSAEHHSQLCLILLANDALLPSPPRRRCPLYLRPRPTRCLQLPLLRRLLSLRLHPLRSPRPSADIALERPRCRSGRPGHPLRRRPAAEPRANSRLHRDRQRAARPPAGYRLGQQRLGRVHAELRRARREL